jgi:hypothetical protein
MKFLTSTVGATANCPDGAVHFIAFVADVASSDNASQTVSVGGIFVLPIQATLQNVDRQIAPGRKPLPIPQFVELLLQICV